jgi:hypothetical protein
MEYICGKNAEMRNVKSSGIRNNFCALKNYLTAA